MARTADVVVLGGGTGGYMAAIRAAQLGKKVIVVEKERLGGTCLHRGCIPSKALLKSAEVRRMVKSANTYGVQAELGGFDLPQAMKRKQEVVETLHSGILTLMKKHKIEVVYGEGRIMGASIFSPRSGVVSVQLPDGNLDTVVPQQLVIATGSRPRQLADMPADGRFIFTSDEVLQLESLPDSVVIIGGGVIGVEWASMFTDFGVDVTLIEMGPRLIPQEDHEMAKRMREGLTARGVTVLTDAAVTSHQIDEPANAVRLHIRRKLEAEDGTVSEENVDAAASMVLVSVGRVPNTEGIGLENTDVKLHNGAIVVNAYMQTNEPHIYAIGDVTGGWQLAHVASHQGIIAAEHGAGHQPVTMDELHVPRCIYSYPEMAAVGISEKQARSLGRPVDVIRFPYQAIGRAHAIGDAGGWYKAIIDREKEELLGVHIIGAQATELISEATLAQTLNVSPEEWMHVIHPHPTLAEGFPEMMRRWYDSKPKGSV